MHYNNLKSSVKGANKSLYNTVGSEYEKLDGRRSNELLAWLRNALKGILELSCGNSRLLDIGCGSGFALRAANGLFSEIYGMDISYNILKGTIRYANSVICADADYIPFKDESMNVIVLFAAMHHFYDHKDLINEIHRVLKRNGILYIDHDMNKIFAKKYSIFLRLYRNIFKREKKYVNAGVDGCVYKLSEYHSDGIDIDKITACLQETGFSILEKSYHWYGLSRLTDILFGKIFLKKSSAPVTRIVAKKL